MRFKIWITRNGDFTLSLATAPATLFYQSMSAYDIGGSMAGGLAFGWTALKINVDLMAGY